MYVLSVCMCCLCDVSAICTMFTIYTRKAKGERETESPHFFVGDEGFALHRNILRPFGRSNLSVKKNSVELPLVQSTKVRGMCFWNFEQ